MPVYEYECEEHGAFELLRAIAEHAEPGSCPTCTCAAPRVMSTPHVSSVPRATMIAHDRNERSRHQPRSVSAPRSDATQKSAARPALKRYGGARPWVIEHG